MNVYITLFLSLLLGTVYYYIMESTIPIDSNCSFIASPWTDILAFIVGLTLIYKSVEYNDTVITMLGGIIIVEHIWQLFPKWTLTNSLKMKR